MTMQRTLRRLVLAGSAIVLLAILAPISGLSAAAPVNLHDHLDDYKGKVVILDFWASWCVPCRRSFPWLNKMQEKYAADGLVVIGVNLDNDKAEAAEFLKDYPARFDIIYDHDKKLARTYDVIAMPSSYVIARDGNVHKRHLGFKVKREDEYEEAIVSALHQEGKSE